MVGFVPLLNLPVLANCTFLYVTPDSPPDPDLGIIDHDLGTCIGMATIVSWASCSFPQLKTLALDSPSYLNPGDEFVDDHPAISVPPFWDTAWLRNWDISSATHVTVEPWIRKLVIDVDRHAVLRFPQFDAQSLESLVVAPVARNIDDNETPVGVFRSDKGSLIPHVKELDVQIIFYAMLDPQSDLAHNSVGLRSPSVRSLRVAIGTYNNPDSEDVQSLRSGLQEGLFPALKHLTIYRYSDPLLDDNRWGERPDLGLLVREHALGELCARLGVKLEW
jgi:hypothetical protein